MKERITYCGGGLVAITPGTRTFILDLPYVLKPERVEPLKKALAEALPEMNGMIRLGTHGWETNAAGHVVAKEED